MNILSIAEEVKFNKGKNELTVRIPESIIITHDVIDTLGWTHSDIVKEYEVKAGFAPGYLYRLDEYTMEDAAPEVVEYLNKKVFERITGFKTKSAAEKSINVAELLKEQIGGKVAISFGFFDGSEKARTTQAALNNDSTVRVEWVEDEQGGACADVMLSHLLRNQIEWTG